MANKKKTDDLEALSSETATLELASEENLEGHIGDPGDPGVLGVPVVVDPNDPWRKVKIKLHRDRAKGKGLYVNVNNHNYYIPRGQVVEVPAFIAEVLENSAEQDENTARLIDSLTESADF